MRAATQATLPRLCIIGPMIGRTHGYVTTQGERLVDLLGGEGYPVTSASASTNRYVRLLDIIRTILRQRNGADLMLLQVFGGPSFVVEDAASWLAKRFRIPIIMVLRGGAMPDFMRKHPRWNRRVLNRAASLVAPSEYLKEAIRPFGFEAEVIPNVINVHQYPYRNRTKLQPRLLWMRAFHPIYNPQMAIRAFERLAAAYPDASMVMAGEEKGLGPECQDLVRQLGLTNSIRFAGFLDMESKIREGSSADIYLNTNRIDNMPVSIVEAGAMGIPVVATAVGGVPYILEHEQTGLLVPDDDAESAAEAITRLLQDSDLAGRLSIGGRRLAEKSSWEEVKPRWTALFDRVAGREPRERGK